MGSLGAPGHFEITSAAVDKGNDHYIQHGIIRDCRKLITIVTKLATSIKVEIKIFLGFVHSC